MKKTTPQLVKNVRGQLQGIERMLADGEDCFKIIIQMRAAKSAMSNVLDKFIQESFLDCASFCKNKKEQTKIERLLSELVKK